MTQGNAVAVTQDERVAVVTNRTDGVVSIIARDASMDVTSIVSSSSRVDIPFHPLNVSKPWAVVVGADDDTAYVLIRGLREVAKLSDLHGVLYGRTPQVTTVQVGSEPTAMVITPSGKSLYVANWGEGTVSTILTKTMDVASLDLNRRLSDEGVLGPLVGQGKPTSAVWTNVQLDLEQRPGLAHPRALAITDDGDTDDADETLYATEFFAQPLPKGAPGGPDDLDHSREGLVYPISLLTNSAPPDTNVITLSATDVGFKDSEGNATGCFPNQLYSAAVSGDRLYITSVCASPKGPTEPGFGVLATNNFKTMVHSAVFVVDTSTNREVPSERVVLTDALQMSYDADPIATGASTEQRMPLIPTDIVVTAPDAGGQRMAYLSAMGSSAVYAIGFAADGTASVGTAGHRFIDLGSAMPIGMALMSGEHAIVVDDNQPGLRLLDLDTQVQASTAATLSHDWANDVGTTADEVLSDDAREGRRLFSTGLTAWSFQGQGWSSCESCHPGGLSDGVTWRFSRGPRRTISLAGTYYRDEPTRRVLLWGANLDEIHDLEAIARSLSGGMGGVVWSAYTDPPGNDCRLLYDGKKADPNHKAAQCPSPLQTTLRENGLNGGLSTLSRSDNKQPVCSSTDTSCDINASLAWTRIDAFIRTIQAPQAPTTLDPTRVAKGAALFEQMRCNACHAGPDWTLSRVFYAPGPVTNGKVPFTDPRPSLPDFSTDEMLGLLRTKQYSVPDAAPTAFKPPAGVRTTFRTGPVTDDEALDYVFAQRKPAPGVTAPPLPADQIQCALRSVGTFPAQTVAGTPRFDGITAIGAPPVTEVRHVLNSVPDAYQNVLSFGGNGFNIPSLVGLAAGAPYFHAGNARTLEEMFDGAFGGHYGAMGAYEPSDDDIRNLVIYLLSIDETGTNALVAPDRTDFDPDLCAQFNATLAP